MDAFRGGFHAVQRSLPSMFIPICPSPCLHQDFLTIVLLVPWGTSQATQHWLYSFLVSNLRLLLFPRAWLTRGAALSNGALPLSSNSSSVPGCHSFLNWHPHWAARREPSSSFFLPCQLVMKDHPYRCALTGWLGAVSGGCHGGLVTYVWDLRCDFS